MDKKKEPSDENQDKMEWLERRYAKWREKKHLDDLLEIEEYLADEPDYLDLDRHW